MRVLVPFQLTTEPPRRIRINPDHVLALDTVDWDVTEIHLMPGICYEVVGKLDDVASRLIEAVERGY